MPTPIKMPQLGETVVEGTVSRWLKQPGDRVEAGQPMIVLEAMKMQNEIQAERSGLVSRVFVTAGEAVEGGDPLVEVD